MGIGSAGELAGGRGQGVVAMQKETSVTVDGMLAEYRKERGIEIACN